MEPGVRLSASTVCSFFNSHTDAEFFVLFSLSLQLHWTQPVIPPPTPWYALHMPSPRCDLPVKQHMLGRLLNGSGSVEVVVKDAKKRTLGRVKIPIDHVPAERLGKKWYAVMRTCDGYSPSPRSAHVLPLRQSLATFAAATVRQHLSSELVWKIGLF